MAVIVIGGNNYTVYAIVADADKYWAAMIGPYADAWTNNPTKKPMAVVQASRLIDRVAWQGTPVGVPQTDVVLQWPRNGVVDRLGNAVSPASVPNQILVAVYELAAGIILDPSLFTTEMSGKNIKKVDAGGGVGVEFFNPTLGITGRFPAQVQELIGDFLAGAKAGSLTGSFSSGTDGTATTAFGSTTGDNGYELTKGLG